MSPVSNNPIEASATSSNLHAQNLGNLSVATQPSDGWEAAARPSSPRPASPSALPLPLASSSSVPPPSKVDMFVQQAHQLLEDTCLPPDFSMSNWPETNLQALGLVQQQDFSRVKDCLWMLVRSNKLVPCRRNSEILHAFCTEHLQCYMLRLADTLPKPRRELENEIHSKYFDLLLHFGFNVGYFFEFEAKNFRSEAGYLLSAKEEISGWARPLYDKMLLKDERLALNILVESILELGHRENFLVSPELNFRQLLIRQLDKKIFKCYAMAYVEVVSIFAGGTDAYLAYLNSGLQHCREKTPTTDDANQYAIKLFKVSMDWLEFKVNMDWLKMQNWEKPDIDNVPKIVDFLIEMIEANIFTATNFSLPSRFIDRIHELLLSAQKSFNQAEIEFASQKQLEGSKREANRYKQALKIHHENIVNLYNSILALKEYKVLDEHVFEKEMREAFNRCIMPKNKYGLE